MKFFRGNKAKSGRMGKKRVFVAKLAYQLEIVFFSCGIFSNMISIVVKINELHLVPQYQKPN